MANLSKFAAVSCIHVPHADEKTKEWLLSQIKGRGLTHFVILGDLLDAAAASVHPDEVLHVLEDEYRQASEYIREIRQALPKSCKLIWCLGNHDDNVLTNDARRIPRNLRSLVHWNRHPEYGEEFRRWKQVPYVKSKSGTYTLGQVVFYHGFDCAQNSDELEGLQMNYMTGGHAWRLTVRGHTHRPVHVTQARRSSKVLLPHYYANVGSIGLGNAQPGYMKRKDVTQWGAGVLLGECKIGKNHRFRSKEWDAELLIKGKD